MTVGINHVYAWTFSNGKLSKSKCSLNGYTRQPFYSVAFTKRGIAAVGCQ